MGINNYYFNNIGARLWDVDNQDFWLSSDNQGQCLDYATDCTGDYDVVTDGLVIWFDINNTGTTIDGSSLTSLVTWDDYEITYTSGSTSNCGCYLPLQQNPTGITLCDWGLTGVDNGRFDMLSGITQTITSADTKVILYPVTGYTVNDAVSVGTKGKYDYPWTFRTGTTTSDGCLVGDTICLNGGFYQGYFKLDLEKPNPIKFTASTVTKCGNETETEYSNVDPDALKYDLGPTNFDCGEGNGGWSMETWIKWDNSYCSTTEDCFVYTIAPSGKPAIDSTWTYTGCNGTTEFITISPFVSTGSTICSESSPTCFSGDCVNYIATNTGVNCGKSNTLNNNFTGNTNFFFYIGTRAENKFRNVFSGESGLYTCDGIVPLQPDEDGPRLTTDGQNWFSISSFGRNGCCNPCTGDTPTIITATTYCDELSENALGFRFTPEGRIGYRKMTVEGHNYWCEESGTTGGSHYMITGTKMEEGYSPDFTISGDTQKWYHVVVTYSQNSVKNGLPAGTLRFWVDGRVVYRVEDFIGLKLRPLNDYSSKQLGVPYNISWGGGSQGLVESQTFGGPDPKDQDLPIATYFTGTFEGELSQLRFYDRTLNLMEIRNNLYVDCDRYCVEVTYGGSQITQPGSPFCDNCT